MSLIALNSVLVGLHFVCPLLFFTDLTRNPYFTQIALLNIGLLSAAALVLARDSLSGRWHLPRTPLDLPILSWLLLCLASWTMSYFGHLRFYREAIWAEGLRVMLFTLVNTVVPFYLAAMSAANCSEDSSISLGPWAIFVLVWGFLWTAYPQMRSPVTSLTSVWSHVWDPYGGLLWAAGLAGILWLARSRDVHALWHVALSAGFLGSAYGICQYFNWEFIWPKVLNPYGGRSVSTFGNPNFMSSYIVLLLPMAVTYYLKAKTWVQQVIYGVLILVFEACLLCSLTRSSWAGALAAVFLLALSPQLRRLAQQDLRPHGLLVTAALAMLFLWPQSTVGGYTATVLHRLAEVQEILYPTQGQPYSPWYQRVLIWLCAWQMGSENPLLGKGWGLFELFYPFYQGHFLNEFGLFRSMRTHANNAHNEILEVWAQTGILGVGFLVWTWAVFFRSALADISRNSVWSLAAACGVFGMLVDNLLNVSLHFAVPAFLFWWQVGIVMGRISHAQLWQRQWVESWRRASMAAGLLALGFCVWGSWHWIKQWNREVHYFMGFKLVRRDQLLKAIEQLSLAYRWHAREVNANYELGNAYARADQFPKAVWAYGEALKSNAGYDEIYFNLGLVLSQRLMDREGALKNYLTAWAINPLSHPVYVHLSGFYMRDIPKYREACRTLLERALHFFPEDLNFLNQLAYLYSLGNDFPKAQDVYIRILKQNPEISHVEKSLRWTISRSGQGAPKILAQVDEFRKLQGRLQAGDYSGSSLALARRVLEGFPDYPKARLYLGFLEMLHGDLPKAEQMLRSVVEKEPSNAQAWIHLAQIFKRLGRRQEAIAALQKALEIDPNDAQAQSELKALR